LEYIELEILNWYKWNPRRDGHKSWWFKISNEIFEDPLTGELSAEEFRAFMYILCQASKGNSALVRIHFKQAKRVASISAQSLHSVIGVFEKAQSFRVQKPVGTLRLEKRREEEIKKEEILLSFPPEVKNDLEVANTPEEVFKSIKDSTKQRWASLYPKDYLEREFVKACGYYFDNGRKRPKSSKGWAQAISSWLERGWKNFAKEQPTQSVDWQKVFEE
jgi:hypothetical protein